MNIISDFWTSEEISFVEAFIDSLEMKASPYWLGNFELKAYYGKGSEKTQLKHILEKFKELAKTEMFGQEITTVFVQRYKTGSTVLPHKDPANNIGNTMIAVFGNFTGAKLVVENMKYDVRAGDIVVLPCTKDGVRGPVHSVDEVLSGTRYALILNTIVKAKAEVKNDKERKSFKSG